MSLAASLILIAAAAAPQAGGGQPRAAETSAPASHGVAIASTTATARVVILTPARIISAQLASAQPGQPQRSGQVYRQVSRQGGTVTVNFN